MSDEIKTDQPGPKPVQFDLIENAHARLMDLTAANNVGVCLLDVLENLARATEALENPKLDFKEIKNMLCDNEQVLQIFFIVNIILKGFLLMVDGKKWEDVVNDNENHVYPKPAVDFLKKVYATNFADNEKKPEQKSPITIVQ